MSNIAEKSTKSKRKSKSAPVIMSEAEIKEFVKSLLSEACYENYAVDGFLFLFKTLSAMAEHNNIKMVDLCNDLQRFVYIESIHCNFMQDKYVETIHERYRRTDYTEKEVDIYRAMEMEVKSPPLDLSACSVADLSFKLYEIKKNPNLPPQIQQCLTEELASVQNFMEAE